MDYLQVYLQLGFEHIIDLQGYDHMLYLMASVVVFPLRQWKKILWLVTAFTVGHSISLAFAVLGWIQIDAGLVEIGIALTICTTALNNLSVRFQKHTLRRIFLTNIFFGLIHGVGFSNFLKNFLTKQEDIIAPLFAFNIGLEMGQLLIVIGFLIVSIGVLKVLTNKYQMIWQTTVLVGIAAVSVYLIYEKVQAIL